MTIAIQHLRRHREGTLQKNVKYFEDRQVPTRFYSIKLNPQVKQEKGSWVIFVAFWLSWTMFTFENIQTSPSGNKMAKFQEFTPSSHISTLYEMIEQFAIYSITEDYTVNRNLNPKRFTSLLA